MDLVLSVTDGAEATFRQALLYAVALLPVSLTLTVLGTTGSAYFVGAALLTISAPLHRSVVVDRLDNIYTVGFGNAAVRKFAPDGTPMANAMLSLMHALGHDDTDSFGDSTGAMSLTMPMSTLPAQG